MQNFDALGDAEKLVWRAAQDGVLCDLALAPRLGSATSSGSGSEQTVRATVLADFLRGLSPDGGEARAIRISNARIEGPLDLEASRIVCALELSDCELDHEVRIGEATGTRISLTRSTLPAFSARQVRIRGDLILADCSIGYVDLAQARIGGCVTLSGSQITNQIGTALNCDGVRVEGDMFFNRTQLAGTLDLYGARISGQVILLAASLAGSDDVCFVGDHLEAAGFIASDGIQAKGEIRLLGATIHGQVELSGAKLSNPEGDAISCDGAVVEGDFFLKEATTNGVIRLPGVRISGQLNLSDAHLSSDTGMALHAPRLVVEEDVLCGAAHISGTMHFGGAQIRGQVNLSQAKLSGPGPSPSDSTVLLLIQATLRHLLLPTRFQPTGVVDLTDANIGRIDDGWPRIRYIARLSGLRYDAVNPLPADIHQRIAWVSSANEGYLPQPYEQLASALRLTGRSDDARRVSIAKEKARRPELGFAGRAASRFLGATVAFGYKPGRGVLLLVLLAAVGWIVFALADAHHRILAIREATQTIPQFHAWLYSLDCVLPVIDFGQRTYWTATGVVLVWRTFSIVAGWVVVTVTLGAVTTRLIRD